MCTGTHPFPVEQDEGSGQASGSLARTNGSPGSILPLTPPLPFTFPSSGLPQSKELYEATDRSLKSLMARCRSQLPKERPLLMSIVLQLQQILVRHVVPMLPLRGLPPLAPMTASLSTYITRKAISVPYGSSSGSTRSNSPPERRIQPYAEISGRPQTANAEEGVRQEMPRNICATFSQGETSWDGGHYRHFGEEVRFHGVPLRSTYQNQAYSSSTPSPYPRQMHSHSHPHMHHATDYLVKVYPPESAAAVAAEKSSPTGTTSHPNRDHFDHFDHFRDRLRVPPHTAGIPGHPGTDQWLGLEAANIHRNRTL